MTEIDLRLLKGLSDAELVDIKEENFQYDYKQKNPIRNVLEMFFDTSLAMLSTSVKSIRFYNYKIATGNLNLVHTWWLNSNLVEVNGKKGLKISFRSSKTDFNEIILLFDKLEIVS